jgi:hypothetical protein
MTDCRGARFEECTVYGLSAWDLKLDEAAVQKRFRILYRESGKRGAPISGARELEIEVDDLRLAQFVYLLLHNENISGIIDTVGKKGVLLLRRFTEGRMEVLKRLRVKLRELGFVPMVFNFDKPQTKNFTETVRLLCNLSRFVVVDITNPSSAPLELQATVPDYMVPFVPILEKGQDPFAMFVDLPNRYDWVLDLIVYPSVDRLIEVLENKIVGPAEAKFNQLLARRANKLRVEYV